MSHESETIVDISAITYGCFAVKINFRIIVHFYIGPDDLIGITNTPI